MNGRRTEVLGTLVLSGALLVFATPRAHARSTKKVTIKPNATVEAPFSLLAGPDYRVVGTTEKGKIVNPRVDSSQSGGFAIDWDEPVVSANGKKVTFDSLVIPDTVAVLADQVWLAAIFKGELSIPGVGVGPGKPPTWEIDTMKTALMIESFSATYFHPDGDVSISYYAHGELGKLGGRLAGRADARGVASPPPWLLDPASSPWEKAWMNTVTGAWIGPLARLMVFYNPPAPYKPEYVTRFRRISGLPRPLFPPPPPVPPGPPPGVAASR